MTWRTHLLEEPASIAALLSRTLRVAVLGIKPEDHANAPAFYVPAYLVNHGFDVIPVPVYYPEVTHILQRPVVRNLRDVPPPIDMVNVFRKAEDIPAHVDDLIACQPRAVWFQLGIRNDAAARQLAEAGIDVVQNRCIMVDHRNAVAHGIFSPPTVEIP
ncbi:MAG TPA: CoA-binding protein [Nevskiaceae bacterium]|nr:CoA-binding protein [Nevskiaceae bacterium]